MAAPGQIDRFEVTMDGGTCAVEIEEMGDGRTRIGIDGRDRVIEARGLGGGAWSFLHRRPGDDDDDERSRGGDAPVTVGGAGAARTVRVARVDGPLEKLVIAVSHPDGEPRTVTAEVAVARTRGAPAGARGGTNRPANAESRRNTDGVAAPVTVRAPIPGKVVKIVVRAGEKVTAGQSLVVLEAMKMENEIRAPRDGTIDALQAQEGASVESGQALLTLI